MPSRTIYEIGSPSKTIFHRHRMRRQFFSGGGGPPYTVVAANNSPDDLKDRADFVCDGTDDQVTMQAGVDTVDEAIGRTVIFIGGTYNTTAPVNLRTQGIYRGLGRAVVRISDFSEGAFRATNKHRFTVSDMSFTGPGSPSTATRALFVDDCGEVYINKVEAALLFNPMFISIPDASSLSLIISECILTQPITGLSFGAMEIQGSGLAAGRKLFVNNIVDGYARGMDLEGGVPDFVISNNWFRNITETGIRLLVARQCLVVGNELSGNGAVDAFRLGSSSDNAVDNLIVGNKVKAGFTRPYQHTANSTGNTIVANDFRPYASTSPIDNGTNNVDWANRYNDNSFRIDGTVLPLTPAATVTDETGVGEDAAVGTSLAYAREDHTHGSVDYALIALYGGA